MNKLPNYFITVALTFIVGSFGVAGWYCYKEYQKPRIIILPDARWEQIFFKEINNATKLSGLEELSSPTVKS